MQDIQVKVWLNPPLLFTPCVGLSERHNLRLYLPADRPLDQLHNVIIEMGIHLPVPSNNERLQFIFSHSPAECQSPALM